MKLFSPCVQKLLSLLAPAFCLTLAGTGSFAATGTGQTVAADGVNVQDVLQSDRFYDSGKGYYWTWKEEAPYRNAYEQYSQTGNFDFLGDLKGYINGSAYTVSAFDKLGEDRNSCWYNVAANVLQYWESYYGVFYTGNAPLVYGLNYDKSLLLPFEGTQSLAVEKYFFDNWTNVDRAGAAVGGNGGMAFHWYLAKSENRHAGEAGYSQLTSTGNGAFFADFFDGQLAYNISQFGNKGKTELVAATDALRIGMGLDANLKTETYGQLVYVGLENGVTEGHALTCYGYTLGADNLLESIYVTNSDDISYSLFRLYVKNGRDGRLHLYEDAACTQEWTFAQRTWYITDFTNINTPQKLKDLYAEYSTGALVWSGAQNVWDAAAVGGTDALPTAAAGWTVHAGDNNYNSYYHSGRVINFTDAAARTAVQLKGALQTANLNITNATKSYNFNGTDGSSIQTGWLHKTGSGTAAFTGTAMTADRLTVAEGTLNLGSGSSLQAGTAEVRTGGTLGLMGGQATFTSGLTVDHTSTLAVGVTSTLNSSLTLEGGTSGATIHFTLGEGNMTAPLLTLTGNLNIGENCRFLFNEADLASGTYVLMNVNGSVSGMENIHSAKGSSFTLSGQQILLTYTAPQALVWTGGSNTWSAAKWNGKTLASSDTDVRFATTSQTNVNVTISGEVAPLNITVSKGTYTFKRGTNGSLAGSGRITINDGATLNANLSLGGRDIILHSGATLVYTPGVAEDTIDGITSETNSHLKLSGNTVFHVIDPAEIRGDITLASGAYVHVSASADTEMFGILKGTAGTTLAFSNNSSTKDITYDVNGERSEFAGGIVVGRDTDSFKTILATAAVSHSVTINSMGELLLSGSGSITGSVQGSGTFTVGKGAVYAVPNPSSIGSGVLFNVAGAATIGSAAAGITTALPDRMAVSGELSTYYNADATSGKTGLNISELALTGGTYMFHLTAQKEAGMQTIDRLKVTSGGTMKIEHNLVSPGETIEITPRLAVATKINELSGDGMLQILAPRSIAISRVQIGGTGSGSYNGGLYLSNADSRDIYPNHQYGATVELGGGTLAGKVELFNRPTTYKSQEYGLTAFGITGDATIGGIEDHPLSGSYTYLYSGRYNGSMADLGETSDKSFVKQIDAAPHTLTINTAETCTFKGKVLGSLSVVKTGHGTQTFSGDTSAFNGGITVAQGTLEFKNAISNATCVAVTGGTLILHGGDATGLSGSDIGDSGLVILAKPTTGNPYHVDMTGAHGNFRVQIQDSDVILRGEASVPAISGQGDVVTTTGTSSITVESGNTLGLGSAYANTGTLTLRGSYDASSLQLTKEGTTTHINTAGASGASGFTKYSLNSVTVVNGGKTVDGGTTITHKDLEKGLKLVLGSDGKATAGGTTDYSSYLLTGKDTANAADILSVAKKHNVAAPAVILSGGTLKTGTGYTMVSGQSIEMGGGSISGKLTTTAGSTLALKQNSAISGALTLNGGTLSLGTYTLTVSGALTLGQPTVFSVDGGLAQGLHTLVSAGSLSGDISKVQIAGMGGEYNVLKQGNSIVLNVIDNNYGIWVDGQGRYRNGETVTVNDGRTITVVGTVFPGNIVIGGDQNSTLTGSGSVGGAISLTKSGAGVLTIGNANSYSGGTVINAGTVSVFNNSALGTGAVIMNGGALNLNGYKLTQNALQVNGEAALNAGTGGALASLSMQAQGVSSADGKLLHGDTLTLSGTLKLGSLNLVKGNIQGGGITVTGTAVVQQGYVGSNMGGTVLEKRGSGTVELAGKNKFTGGITVIGGNLSLLEGGSTEAAVTVKGGAALRTAQTVKGDIKLENKAAMYLRPGATYKLTGHKLSSAGGTLHGSLTTGNGSVTELSGAGLAVTHDATLGGGSIQYSGSAVLNVAGTLTLASTTSLSGNWQANSTYTIMKAGKIANTSGLTLYDVFNMSKAAYTLSNTGAQVTVTPKAVKSALARMTLPSAGASLQNAQTEALLPPDDVTEATAPQKAARLQGTAPDTDAVAKLASAGEGGVITETAVRGIADSIVQADWGVLTAARSFSASLHHHVTADSQRRSAVWADALGGMTRQSSHNGHAGADSNLSGGAVGVETAAGDARTPIGMGFGYTNNRVNPFGQQRLRQNAWQLGLYAMPGMQMHGATYSLALSAAYGRTETRGTLGHSREHWKQDSLVLSARGNVGTEHFSGFAGLEYAATDSGRIDDVRTGAVQNLQGEVGVRSGTTVGKASFYAEAALTGDLVRHNPGVDLGSMYDGANPGRIGGRVSVGASYSVSDAWDVHASYSFEGVKHSNSHSAVIGTTYKF